MRKALVIITLGAALCFGCQSPQQAVDFEKEKAAILYPLSSSINPKGVSVNLTFQKAPAAPNFAIELFGGS